jgi:hypothetical protein
MTKGGYKLIAAVLRSGYNLIEKGYDAKGVFDVMLEDFIAILSANNPRFDAALFRKAVKTGDQNVE